MLWLHLCLHIGSQNTSLVFLAVYYKTSFIFKSQLFTYLQSNCSCLDNKIIYRYFNVICKKEKKQRTIIAHKICSSAFVWWFKLFSRFASLNRSYFLSIIQTTIIKARKLFSPLGQKRVSSSKSPEQRHSCYLLLEGQKKKKICKHEYYSSFLQGAASMCFMLYVFTVM